MEKEPTRPAMDECRVNDGNLEAIADYLFAQPPLVHDVAKH